MIFERCKSRTCTPHRSSYIVARLANLLRQSPFPWCMLDDDLVGCDLEQPFVEIERLLAIDANSDFDHTNLN